MAMGYLDINHFGPRREGVLSYRPCQWSVGPSIFKYLRDRLLVFLILDLGFTRWGP